MKIAVIGNGLVSQVSATLFASVGNHTVLFEHESLDDAFLKEPGLEHLYHEQHSSGRLSYLTKNEFSKTHYKFILLSETTPKEAFDKFRVELEPSITHGAYFIILTPSEIGEAQQFSSYLHAQGYRSVVCCIPLLVREGRAINDFSRPESIFLGCDDEAALPDIKQLLYPFNRVRNVIKIISTKEAEFTSFAGNAMLATRLSFMNEMASLAERCGVDIEVIRECIGRDPRIGQDYLYPGCGFGGKSLTDNVEKIARILRQRNDDAGLLDTVLEINRQQKDLLFRKLWRYFNTQLEGKTIAIWGATFKPGSSSFEQSPALQLIASLLDQSARVNLYDPSGAEPLRQHFNNNKNLTIANSSEQACEGADALAICTEWKEFWNPDFSQLIAALNHPVIFDGRNLYDPSIMKKAGITYFGIGRGERV